MVNRKKIDAPTLCIYAQIFGSLKHAICLVAPKKRIMYRINRKWNCSNTGTSGSNLASSLDGPFVSRRSSCYRNLYPNL
jgi:hypothetical protein